MIEKFYATDIQAVNFMSKILPQFLWKIIKICLYSYSYLHLGKAFGWFGRKTVSDHCQQAPIIWWQSVLKSDIPVNKHLQYNDENINLTYRQNTLYSWGLQFHINLCDHRYHYTKFNLIFLLIVQEMLSHKNKVLWKMSEIAFYSLQK